MIIFDYFLLKFYYTDHHKFYEIGLNNNQVKIIYGRIGSSGKCKINGFSSEEDSVLFFEKLIIQKMKKGYHLTSKGKTPPRKKGIHTGQLLLPFLLKISLMESTVVV
jgi:predicted DNA-binding WGR domain protein